MKISKVFGWKCCGDGGDEPAAAEPTLQQAAPEPTRRDGCKDASSRTDWKNAVRRHLGLEDALCVFDRERDRLTRELDRLERERSQAALALVVSEVRRGRKEAKAAGLERENAALRAAAGRGEAATSRLTGELAAAAEGRKLAARALDGAREECGRLARALTASEEDRGRLAVALDRAEVDRIALEHELKNSERERSRLAVTLSDSRRERAALQETLRTHAAEKDRLMGKLQQMIIA